MNNGRFGVFFDPTKTTSGQRFYRDLCAALKTRSIPLDEKPSAILFNISAPVSEIVKAKIRGQKVVLRVDGLWWDRISPAFLENFWWPTRMLLTFFARFKMTQNITSDIANLLDDNYTGFFRILLADHIVYQSVFSKQVHQRYFPNKNHSVIGNASRSRQDIISSDYHETDLLKLCVIYSEAPAKGIYQILKFVKWLSEVKHLPVRLYVVGFNGKVPKYAPDDMQSLIMNSGLVDIYPPFDDFDPKVTKILSEAHCCLCFSFRDPCPNAVVESMAHHLPVVGIASGGVPEIVHDAGELIDWDDWKDGHFAAHRYEFQEKDIDFEQMFSALNKVLNNLNLYRMKVRQRLLDDLDVDVCAERYAQVLEKLAQE
ncbi:MAG: glycosyltransferase [Proteobacteria bacterium]|nr:glycosyltransferase [Desulfobulbaceae bacterium]MBU4153158.1 glycosyltransferase [Pseudomonadota bacterium]